MGDTPWLTIVGVGEDGHDGLPAASRSALAAASTVIGPPRHLALIPETGAKRIEWPVPFADGLEVLDGERGRPTVVLASGDPFWFGAGSVLARRYAASEWRAIPGASVFSHAAARLGWAMEATVCLGLHAAPLSRLRPHLAPGARIVATLRDGGAVAEVAAYLDGADTDGEVTVLEALGGPRERVRPLAEALSDDVASPVAVAIEVRRASAIPLASGRPDALFAHDGQITKQPVRALTLSALAPRPGEHLWDIGSGSGSIAIEWLLSHPSLTATSVEPHPERAARIARNAAALGVDRLQVIEGRAPEVLRALPEPAVVFVGGGLSAELLCVIRQICASGTRIVANAVTLQSEALLIAAQADLGGELLRIELSHAAALGPKTAWSAAYPITRWSGTL